MAKWHFSILTSYSSTLSPTLAHNQPQSELRIDFSFHLVRRNQLFSLMATSDFTISVLLAIGPLSGILFGLYTSYISWRDSPFRTVPYPPGPPSDSLLQCTRDSIHPSRLWKAYSEWLKVYGNILHVKNKKQHIIVLNSLQDAKNMLDGRCAFYSQRPWNIMIDLMGWNFNTKLLPYGHLWRGHRKLYQQCFRPNAITAYRPIQEEKVHKLLLDILDTPDEFKTHCKSVASGVIVSIFYGTDTSLDTDDYFVKLAKKAGTAYNKCHNPESLIVNYMPSLRYLPPWLPGAYFQRVALAVKTATEEFVDIPMDYIGKGLLKGTASPSLLVDLLENCYMQRDFDRIKHIAATTYLEGIDTTTSTLLSFILAMAHFPEVQKRAQQEIDYITAKGRLPDFKDRKSLPYMEALYREVLRWRPPIPLNTPHVATEPDIYNGFHIPKGATVIANIWAMTRDPEQYPNPESFNPERFLDSQGKLSADDCTYVFGFGRRICPGRHLASDTAWLSIVSILSVFDIMVSDGAGDVSEVQYSDGPVSQPFAFSCSITPRNLTSTKLVRAMSKVP